MNYQRTNGGVLAPKPGIARPLSAHGRRSRSRRPLGPPLCSTTFGGSTVPPLFVGGGGGSGVDPVGTRLSWNADNAGAEIVWQTPDASTFANSFPQLEIMASKVGLQIGSNRNSPPSLPKQRNYITNDGVTWTDVSASPGNYWSQSVGVQVQSLIYLEHANIFQLKEGVGSGAFLSSDGVAWTPSVPWGVSVSFTQQGYFTDGSFDYLLGGGEIRRSSDGVTWSFLQSVSNTSGAFYDPNMSPPYWLVGGNSSSSRVYSSNDGVTWTRNATSEANLDALGLLSYSGLAVAHSRNLNSGNGLTVVKLQAAGGGTSTQRDAWSPDMINWFGGNAIPIGLGLRLSATLGQFCFLTFNFFNGTLYTSSDGITWTANVYAAFTQNAGFGSSDILTSL